jgi:ATP-binding cassette subfamily C (CFTR/MRP) protein 1
MKPRAFMLNLSRCVYLLCNRASVDLETDNKIQRTIQTQFKDRTLICIARVLIFLDVSLFELGLPPDRLRTIIFNYDSSSHTHSLQEFDTPLNLFNKDEGLFRNLCEKSNVTLADIEKAIVYDDID